MLFAVCVDITGTHIHDAVYINIKGDFNLWAAAFGCGNPIQDEVAEELVIDCFDTFPLQDMDFNGRLIILRSREHLTLEGRDRRVARDQRGHHPARGLDTEGQRRDIQQQDILDFTRQYASLDGSAYGYHFVWVDAFVWVFFEELFDGILDRRHPRLTAHENDFFDIGGLELGVSQRFAHRFQ